VRSEIKNLTYSHHMSCFAPNSTTFWSFYNFFIQRWKMDTNTEKKISQNKLCWPCCTTFFSFGRHQSKKNLIDQINLFWLKILYSCKILIITRFTIKFTPSPLFDRHGISCNNLTRNHVVKPVDDRATVAYINALKWWSMRSILYMPYYYFFVFPFPGHR